MENDDFRNFRDVTRSVLGGAWRAKKALRAALAGRSQDEFCGEIKLNNEVGHQGELDHRHFGNSTMRAVVCVLTTYRVTDPAADKARMHRIGFDGTGITRYAAAVRYSATSGQAGALDCLSYARKADEAAVELVNGASSEEHAPGKGPTLDAARQREGDPVVQASG